MKNFVRMVMLSAVLACLTGCDGWWNEDQDDEDNTASGWSITSDFIVLDGKKWMKKNLNVETADSWCYDNNPANCDKYGRLYTWEAAEMACQSIGMSLPSSWEWSALEGATGYWEEAGKKLKSTSDWDDDGNGTNEYGFSALPGGYRDTEGSFFDVGKHGNWWTGSEVGIGGGGNARYRLISYGGDLVHAYQDSKGHGFSVRCFKDK